MPLMTIGLLTGFVGGFIAGFVVVKRLASRRADQDRVSMRGRSY